MLRYGVYAIYLLFNWNILKVCVSAGDKELMEIVSKKILLSQSQTVKVDVANDSYFEVLEIRQ